MVGKKSQQKPEKQICPLTITTEDLAFRLGISLRHCQRLNEKAEIPRPVRLGTSVRWPLAEIQAWLVAGAPSRKNWELIKSK